MTPAAINHQTPGPASPVVTLRPGALNPLGIHDVVITGGFWARAQEVNASATLPHADGWIERLGWVDNFTSVHGRKRTGRVFTDSDVYKLLEAQCWEFGRTGDLALGRLITDITAAISCSAEPDGYLNTYFGQAGPGRRYTDFGQGHELYCYGHLIQAAVARLRTTGPDELTELGCRVADHLSTRFGVHGEPAICGHPGVEMALVELYRATGEQRYLDTARLQIDRRGHGLLGPGLFGAAYCQDDQPVREATMLRGHAVRALYLACGAVDVATETGDHRLLQAVVVQWDNTLARRTYVTGGMGSRPSDESFGDDFELPPDSAYAETCAGIGLIMLGFRLLLATGDTRYADTIEHVLYNIAATSPSRDGRSFFYANTLHRRSPMPTADLTQASTHATVGGRQAWYTVPCCPTNLARTFASLASYIATTTDDGIQIHQYATGTIRTHRNGAPLTLSVSTDYPFHGSIKIVIDETPTEPWRLTLRIPQWCTQATVTVDGDTKPVESGALHLNRHWRPGTVILLELPISDIWIEADPRIDAVRGQTALQRGPILYCAETPSQEADPQDLDLIAVARTPADSSPQVAETSEDNGAGHIRSVGGFRRAIPRTIGWSYHPDHQPVPAAPITIPMIPYHEWGNRGPSTMRVWLPRINPASTPDGPRP